mmetsp:Transcript_18480/g.38518  ORF Transcript_18480/g.38518 Transcript_18480/m.38518 type:complete len:587 (+) Transcript_18480:75-1835(+)
MFKQPFLFLSHSSNGQKQRFSYGNDEATSFACDAGMLSSMPAASTFTSKLTGGEDSTTTTTNNNTWTNKDWYRGRHANVFCSSRAISAITNSIGIARGGGGPSSQLSLSAEQNKYEYTNTNNHNIINLNAYYCEAGKANTTTKYNTKNNRDRSDSDTATATTTQTSPTASMLSDYSFSEDENEENTIEFFLEDIDESAYSIDDEKEDGDGHDCVDKAITNSDTFGHDDNDDVDVDHDHDNDDYDNHWSHPEQIRRNSSFMIRKTLEEAKEASLKTTTTTKTKTTTTTTTTHTTAATIMATKHKNKNIFVYPHLFPGKSESVIQASANVGNSTSKNNEHRRVSTKISNSNDVVVPYHGPEGDTAIVTAPETAVTEQQQCCPCCASKQRIIERQANELKHMNVLVKKLCGLLADTVLSKKNNSDGHNRLVPPTPKQEAITNYSHNETIYSASPKICSSNEKDASTANTSTSLDASSPTTSSPSSSSLSPFPRRNISSLSITRVGAHCPRSKKHRIQVNGNAATYSGPTIATESSDHYQRAAILQGCVVRFDNGELYVGSLSRNDTGSLTFHPPGTLYDFKRAPKRRIR